MENRIHGANAIELQRRMATRARPIDDIAFPDESGRLYTACFFEHEAIVPWVQLLAAESDEEAIAELRSSHVFMTRELWDRHRLVALIPPGEKDSLAKTDAAVRTN